MAGVVVAHSCGDQCMQLRTLFDEIVGDEAQFGAVAQTERTAQRSAQKTRRAVQYPLRDFGIPRAPQHGVEHLRVSQIGRDFHMGQRHRTEARVLDLAAYQLAQRALDLLAYAAVAGKALGHGTDYTGG